MQYEYFYTFSTPKDRGQRMPQTTAQTARNACPIGASLYRQTNTGSWHYMGYRKAAQCFVRVED